MWKWFKRLTRIRYYIEERENYYGTIHYIVHMSGTTKKLSVLCPEQNIRAHNVEWYNLNAFATAFKTIEEAELALQQAIWKSAFRIKRERKQVMRSKRVIKVPPWGN